MTRAAAKRPGAQALGRKYFLMLSPSALNITRVPRCWRICLLVRLIMPWRLPDMADNTLPVPVILKRFLAPDFVFNLGIWLSLAGHVGQNTRVRRTIARLSVPIEHFAAATAALWPGSGRRRYGRGGRAVQPRNTVDRGVTPTGA